MRMTIEFDETDENIPNCLKLHWEDWTSLFKKGECIAYIKKEGREIPNETKPKETECDFCGKKGEWKNVLRDPELKKTDGSDLILCNKCLNHYVNRDFHKIKLKNPEVFWCDRCEMYATANHACFDDSFKKVEECEK